MKWLTAALLTIAAVLGGLLLFRTLSPAPLGGDALGAPKPLPALKLTSERGQPTRLNESDGRVRLVFYGFVRCPDVCPATLTSLKTTYDTLSPELRKRVLVQFITVDPEHDTPAVVQRYLAGFNPSFSGLTGKAETIDEAARQMFVTNVRPLPARDHSSHQDTPEASGSGADNAQQAGATAREAARLHGDQVSVVDGQGRFVRVYGNADVIGGVLERDLPQLVRQYAN
ncbi:SCO family protein [Deinococcus deserti]|uniref:Putative electron transport protein SCO1/SenC n=1 Tax=Deinococcus deserti (strain DSM 17065 / CIP 109153 / LMG 22923 / VCD115) TaxID=546414 RepID=C1CXA4_DEIDV|nr:SCO family protein [Deinococcus deserti]ACO46821.1 putative electron transport protein SCO1/SenC [Deinococcus deserti VCD115]